MKSLCVIESFRSRRSVHEYFTGGVADAVVKRAPGSVLVYRR